MNNSELKGKALTDIVCCIGSSYRVDSTKMVHITTPHTEPGICDGRTYLSIRGGRCPALIFRHLLVIPNEAA